MCMEPYCALPLGDDARSSITTTECCRAFSDRSNGWARRSPASQVSGTGIWRPGYSACCVSR